jgi:hypothetical protein
MAQARDRHPQAGKPADFGREDGGNEDSRIEDHGNKEDPGNENHGNEEIGRLTNAEREATSHEESGMQSPNLGVVSMKLTLAEFQSKVAASLTEAAIAFREGSHKATYSVASNGDEKSRFIALSAHLKETAKDAPELVELVISLRTSAKTMNGMVVWEHPSPRVEAEYSGQDVELTPENLGQLYCNLPRLISAFEAAVGRGGPPSDF